MSAFFETGPDKTAQTNQPTENQRLVLIEKLFGIHFPLRLELTLYGIAAKMTQGQYSGGYWQFYVLDHAEVAEILGAID